MEIEFSAFYLCTSLTDLQLPEGLEEIETSVFACCTSLKPLKIPSTVKVQNIDPE